MDFYRFLASRTDRMKASEVRELVKYSRRKDIISFGGGLPDPASLPSKEEIVSAIEFISSLGDRAFQYSPTSGVPELKTELAKFCRDKLDIKASEDEIIVVTGSQQALDISSRILINQRDYIITELPTYIAAVQAFNLMRPNYLGVPMDQDGMKLECLERSLRMLRENGLKPKFLYTIPTCQNPAGISMSMDRRKHLLELASKYDFIILEDDPYSQIIFKQFYFKRLKSIDSEGRVIYMSTFSKIYAPGVRIGWVVADKSIINFYELAKQFIDLCSSSINQYIILHALQSNLIEKRIPLIVQRYKKKCELMYGLLKEMMPEDSVWTNPVGGMFIFGWLNEKINTKKLLIDVIEKYGVAYVPGASFFVDGTGWNTMRLNFSFPDEEQIKVGIERLSKAVKEEAKKV
ncbi:MAG: PLP-dependent aminotransferase family protein [Nitrososphaeria archaeon]|nr:PLP-dependent aminotransferase family protein [Nitrososphaeria archaeon]